MPNIRGRRGGGGRIHPRERNTNDAAPLLGDGLEVVGNFQQQYNESIGISMRNKNRKDYHARLARMTKYWKE